jgi:hypothetical protein
MVCGVAVVGSGPAAIFSKRQHHLVRFAGLAAGIVRAVRERSAILDGEIIRYQL